MSIVNLACSAMLAAARTFSGEAPRGLQSGISRTGGGHRRFRTAAGRSGARFGLMFKKRCSGLLSRRYSARMLARSCANVQFGVLLPFGSELGAIILREEALATQQFRNAAGFDDSSPIENDDSIAALYGR
jgi:hypothetical protein